MQTVLKPVKVRNPYAEHLILPGGNKYRQGYEYQVVRSDKYHRLLSGTRNYKSLEKLYDNYSKKTLRDKRNKMILGLLKGTDNKRPVRKSDHFSQELTSERMFCSIGGSEMLKSTLLHMFRSIQQDHQELKNAMQIRISVITH